MINKNALLRAISDTNNHNLVKIEELETETIISWYGEKVIFYNNNLILSNGELHALDEIIQHLIAQEVIIGWTEFDNKYIGWNATWNLEKDYYNLLMYQNKLLLEKINIQKEYIDRLERKVYNYE